MLYLILYPCINFKARKQLFMNILYFKALNMQKVIRFVFETNVIATVSKSNILDYSCFCIIPKSTVVGLARLFWKILQDVGLIGFFPPKILTKSISLPQNET